MCFVQNFFHTCVCGAASPQIASFLIRRLLPKKQKALYICTHLSFAWIFHLKLDALPEMVFTVQHAIFRQLFTVVRSATILLMMTKATSKLFHHGYRSQHTCSLHNVVATYMVVRCVMYQANNGGRTLVCLRYMKDTHIARTIQHILQHAPTLVFSVSKIIPSYNN